MVLGTGELSGHEIWLFSASADNSDIMASVLAARARGTNALRIMTRNPEGSVARAIAALSDGKVLFTPVFNFALHSLWTFRRAPGIVD